MSTPSIADGPPVRMHLTISEAGRRALRLVAAARGINVGHLVEHWATAEADALGLRGQREVRDVR